ncbi:MAG: rod shape-determining protein RodA [Candidatus Jacksonbacteria bacterium]|nr:rod shape-determining protein RodA [Candidatus Jacksonbacteria bacterium]
MRISVYSRFHNFDWEILISSAFLILIGCATLYSLELNKQQPDFSLLIRQASAAFLGFFLLAACLFFDFRHLRDYAYILYGFSLAALIAVLFLGATIRGTTGWFSFSGVTFQPVEAFKIFFIVALAKFFSSIRTLNRPNTLFTALSFLAAPGILILLQPDLGSFIVLCAIFAGYLFLMKLRRVLILSFILATLLAGVIGWQFLAPYQKDRIQSYFNPEQNQKAGSYNVTQSKIAIGSGRFFGRGLGLGTQSSLHFLPEEETDFIFAVISESLGFTGGGLLIALYAFLLSRIMRLASRAHDAFGSEIAFGIFFWFAFQGFANIGMNLGLVPVFGVPLPFVSYGGSSLLASIVAIGVLESVALFAPQRTV